tara:strand:- start:638 stop:898 length:261 start_codon:yes stop_codon:yes gene_type:complete
MPVYAYKCHTCRHVFEVRHGMFFESQRCIKCHSDDIQKIPTEIFIENTDSCDTSSKRPGKLIDEFIEESRKEVKKEKEKLKKQELK